MNFENALSIAKNGGRITREGWNGKEMFIFVVSGSVFSVSRPPLLGIFEEGIEIKYNTHMDMKTADGSISTWVCSQGDLFAEDWVEVHDCGSE